MSAWPRPADELCSAGHPGPLAGHAAPAVSGRHPAHGEIACVCVCVCVFLHHKAGNATQPFFFLFF